MGEQALLLVICEAVIDMSASAGRVTGVGDVGK